MPPPRRRGKPINPAANANAEESYDEEANANPTAANSGQEEENMDEEEVTNSTILKEIREYRQEIKTEFAKTNSRLDEAEKRIVGNEERLQDVEEVITGMLKIQEQLQEKLTDQECRSRRDNIRIYGIPEQEPKDTSSKAMITFVEKVLRENIGIPASVDLQIERAHRALAPKPPPDAKPRSILVKFQSFRVKEEVIRLAWQKKGLNLDGHRISLDHDYAPAILRKRKAYAEARRVLKANNIRFQTLYPSRLRVHYEEGQITYETVEEATADMASRGLPVTVIEMPATLWERVQQAAWHPVRTKRSVVAGKTQSFKQKLQVYRRTSPEDVG
uniref:L1 transposable element RRM domain-containing protein n=1 Tax=Neogobius melanostomus TaxID=47308 RepID=A0A8C6WE40_9GOBI